MNKKYNIYVNVGRYRYLCCINIKNQLLFQINYNFIFEKKKT